jgi:SAM-dependent methyltransferase
MMEKLKYSKSSAFYLDTKTDFFSGNDDLQAKITKQNALYTSQPPRENCKICDGILPKRADFHQHGVEYCFCGSCGHLNGRHEDTEAFVKKLYSSDSGADYSVSYVDQNYEKRMIDIYLPKVDFLLENLPKQKTKLLDVGCGSGFFVFASLKRGIEASGIDISKTMVEFGNSQISRLVDKRPLQLTDEAGFFQAIKNTDAQIVSAVGVIEHLREPNKFFEAFRSSKAKHLFYSVPMFSFSVILENAFPSVFPRQLSGGHTHLFTESSLSKMHDLAGVKSTAEWRFGTDMMDLFRSCLTTLQKNSGSSELIKRFVDGFGPKIDELQNVLDKNHFCSEIHCLTMKI